MTAPREPEFKGLADAPKEIDAARRFVTGVLKRRHLRPEIIEQLNAILSDIGHLPGRKPETSCEITVSAGYGDQDIGGTEFHTFRLEPDLFELASGGTSFSGPVDVEDFIDAYRFAADAEGFQERKMDVTGWIAEVEECCADPAYHLEMELDV